MENKNKNSNTSSSENNSNPFPKLKPTGSIYIHQIPIESDNKSSQNNSNTTQEKEEKDFLSKLRVFDPNAKINTNNYNDIKHSKTFKPSTSVFNKEINKDNMYEIKEDENEKEIDEVLNINKERELLSKKTQQNETGNFYCNKIYRFPKCNNSFLKSCSPCRQNRKLPVPWKSAFELLLYFPRFVRRHGRRSY